MRKSFAAGFIIDVFIVTASYALCIWMKPGVSNNYFDDYFVSFLLFLLIWIIVSFSLEKYSFRVAPTWTAIIKKIMIINLFIFFIVTSMMYLFQSFNYSRFIVLGTVGVTSLVELILGSFYFLIIDTRVKYENGTVGRLFNGSITGFRKKDSIPLKRKAALKYDFRLRELYLKNEIGDEAFDYLIHYAAIDSPNTLVIATTTRFNIDTQIQPQFECILNIRRVNDFRYINKFFESVNVKLPVGGLYIDFFESKNMRKRRILNKFPIGINYIYYALDFLIKMGPP